MKCHRVYETHNITEIIDVSIVVGWKNESIAQIHISLEDSQWHTVTLTGMKKSSIHIKTHSNNNNNKKRKEKNVLPNLSMGFRPLIRSSDEYYSNKTWQTRFSFVTHRCFVGLVVPIRPFFSRSLLHLT